MEDAIEECAKIVKEGIAEDKRQSQCMWREQEDFYGFHFDTKCHQGFTFNEGRLEENSFEYCPYCGKTILVIPLINDVEIIDLKDMPDYNPKVKNGIDSVSTGKVSWTHKNKATCHEHGAMLCVSPDRKIWRCPECHVGCYVANPPVEGKI